MQAGLTLWDTAVVYGMGASETILGKLAKSHDDVILSTKFTPEISESGEDAMAVMCEGSLDLYWIHNLAGVERWTPCLISLLRSGKMKRVGVSNRNLDQIKRALHRKVTIFLRCRTTMAFCTVLLKKPAYWNTVGRKDWSSLSIWYWNKGLSADAMIPVILCRRGVSAP